MRTFVAIELGPVLIDAIAELRRRLARAVPEVKWIPPEKIHLTLKFLGEIDEAQLHLIQGALAQAAEASEPIELRLKSLGSFGPRGHVNVVWVGVKDSSGRLLRLQSACESSLAALGIPREDRPFKAHLTLARNKNPGADRRILRAIQSEIEFAAGPQPVMYVTLFRSLLSSEGATYEALSRHRIGGAEIRSCVNDMRP